jgi:hypothetical protein
MSSFFTPGISAATVYASGLADVEAGSARLVTRGAG